MTDENLNNLLRTADDHIPAPRLDAALSARIRARSQRRGRTLAIAASFTLAATAGALFWSLQYTSIVSPRGTIAQSEQRSVPPSSNQISIAEFQRLRNEANLQEALIQRLCDAESQAHHREKLGRELQFAGMFDALDAERTRAAATLVHHADRLQQHSTDEAAQSYRLVLAKFPATASAHTARARLNAAK